MPKNGYIIVMEIVEDNPLITFIIPSIGRNTLGRTLNSLMQQTVGSWKAIVVFDGVDINLPIKDNRISYYKIPKVGIGNNAGEVRNFGMDKVTSSDWIGFVDDDDVVSSKYVERLQQEISISPDAKCIIFRMLDTGIILPRPSDSNFSICKVGISFAVRADLGARFAPSKTEDFDLLNAIRNNKEKIVISPYVSYFVRSDVNKSIDSQTYGRINIFADRL